MVENTTPMAGDRNAVGTPRTAPQKRSPVENTTKLGLVILVFIVIAFTYDDAVSNIMYALGYDRNKISNLWFLRNQYEYLTDVRHVAGLTPDTFHVFELFVWAMIPLNLARIAKSLFPLGYTDDVRSPWNKNLSGGTYVLGLFLFSSVCLALPLFAPDFSKEFLGLFGPFPKAAVALQAWYFCVCCLLLANAVVGFIQLNLGRSRRDHG